MEDAEASEGLNDWEPIQSPWPQTQQRWDEVVEIRDNYLHQDSSIFPPNNHEGLPINPQDNQLIPASSPGSSSSYYSSSQSSSSDEGADVSRGSCAGEIGRRLRSRLNVFSSRIYRVTYMVRNYAVCRGGFWSFLSVTGVLAVLLMSLVYVKVQRWRRRVQQEIKDYPMLLIKEKDEKIKQLLLQITQMNELLSARRRVPVVRVG